MPEKAGMESGSPCLFHSPRAARTDRVILAALLPDAPSSFCIRVAKKKVLPSVSIKPMNHPLISCPSTRPVPVFP